LTWHGQHHSPIFADGNTPTHTQLNQYLDNMSWLNAPPTDNYEYPSETDITTVSTNWAQISADFALSISVGAGAHVLAVLSVSIERMAIDIEFDGTRLGSAPATTGEGIAKHTSAIDQHVTIVRPFFNLSAGVHTFTAVMKATSGTGTIFGTRRPRFYVREL
jgi:hypothetical protein